MKKKGRKFLFLAGDYDSSENLNSKVPEIGNSQSWGEPTRQQKEIAKVKQEQQTLKGLRKEREKEEKEDSPSEKRLMVINGAKLNCPYAQKEGTLKVTSNEIHLQDRIWATEGDRSNMINLQFPGLCNHPKWGNKKPPCQSVIFLSNWENVGTTTVQEQKVLVKESYICCEPVPNTAVARPIPKVESIEMEDILDPADYIVDDKGFVTRFYPDNDDPTTIHFDLDFFRTKANLYNYKRKKILSKVRKGLIEPLVDCTNRNGDGQVLNSVGRWISDPFIGTGFSCEEIRDLFKLLADNMDRKIEWSFHSLVKGNEKIFLIGTEHKENEAINHTWVSEYFKQGCKIEEDWHSHPDKFPELEGFPSGFYKDGSIRTDEIGDRDSYMREKKRKYLVCNYFYVYVPHMPSIKDKTIWYNDKEFGYGFKK